MSAEIRRLTEDDLPQMVRPLIASVVTKYILIVLIGLFLTLSGLCNCCNLVVVCIVLITLELLQKIQWISRVKSVFQTTKPVKLSIFVSESLAPTSGLKATIHDPRSFNPFAGLLKPSWTLLPTNWDANKMIGGSQECLAYIDNESQKVFAFSCKDGIVFTEPYLAPWSNLDRSIYTELE